MDSIALAVNNEPFIEAKSGSYEWDAPQLFTDNVTFTKPNQAVISTVAAAGTTVADATAVSPNFSFLTVTAADAAKGIIIGAIPIGAAQSFYNVNNAALLVYPPTGGNFNAGSTNAAITVSARKPFTIRNIDGVLFVATYT